MKKLFFIALVCVTSHFTVKAQNTRFGFTAGTTFNNYKAKADSTNESGKPKTGITIGVLVDIPVSKHFSFQPAVNFLQKRTTDEETPGGGTRLSVNCIEVPLNFLYNTRGNSGNFFIGAGPSVAIALSGKYKISDDVNPPVSLDVKFGKGDDDNMKRLDMGANFMTGYCFSNGLFLSANYNMGLSNLFPGGSTDGTLKSHYFGIKLGYLLKGKK